ncbi:MAG TPA: CaiB/BaiF CoA-transferase family protein [Alphaproteobacteria bacterium]|nr:CaiB/BaiF CoA-transferase family protein [Alphaproteobacteria bacterium]
MSGPLSGVKIIEFQGIGPAPFCGMLLSDMGADVVRIDRKARNGTGTKFDIGGRGRRSISLDLKKPEAIETCLKLVEKADILFEGFRPGVMERLGLGPDLCLARNKRLVYGRMTGWGQDGPYSQMAGHDINYIAITGALRSCARPGEKPVHPLNLVGDFGGGALYLAVGLLAALHSAKVSGLGQVVDCSMTDGAASLMSMFYGMSAAGSWSDEVGNNLLDGGAPFYDSYLCSDGNYISIGSIEPQFYAELLEKLGLSDDPDFRKQMDKSRWPALKQRLTSIFKTRTRDEWSAIMENTDICYGPVLTLKEALKHPHNVARKTFVEVEGVPQPAPAPRFSRTVSKIQSPPAVVGQHTESALQDWGLSAAEVEALRKVQAI